MADFVINSIIYSGSMSDLSHPQRPNTFKRRRIRVGRTVVGMDGTTSWVHRGHKWEWEFGWEYANQTTETAVLAVRNLTTTFPFVDHLAASFTAIVVGDDSYEESLETDVAGAYKYGLSLVFREA